MVSFLNCIVLPYYHTYHAHDKLAAFILIYDYNKIPFILSDVEEEDKVEQRAEKILQGEDVSSSEEEEELKERNYHTDTDSDLVREGNKIGGHKPSRTKALPENALRAYVQEGLFRLDFARIIKKL